MTAAIPLASLKSPSLKRRAASPELSDSENVDPRTFDPKRKRISLDSAVSLSKPSRYSLPSAPFQGPRVLPATPRIDTVQKNVTPMSAPAAAGRSPTRKRTGLNPRRFVPPVSIKSPALSITAALQGTLANKKARKVRTDSKPKSWFFDIFEEPEHAQHDRINDWTMSQSATNLLDISDDEGKSEKANDRGKENIDPDEVSAPLTRSMAAARAASEELKKDIMEDDRAPLAELETSKYYSEGLDATSVVLVHDDEHVTEQAAPKSEFTFDAGKALPTDLDTTSIADVIKSSTLASWVAPEALASVVAQPSNEIPRLELGDDLEIWESASAKDENEDVDGELVEKTAFALQEL